MDFRLCPDINATRRLVEDEDPWGGNQPFCQQYLLLVAARERVRLLLDSGCDNSHPGRKITGDLRLRRTVDESETVRELPEDRERLVRTNRKLKDKPLLMTILGQERDSKLHRVPRRTRSCYSAIHADLAAIRLYNAEKHLRDLGSPRANQAEKAQNLACPDFEPDVLDESGAGEVAYGEDRHANFRLFLWEESSGLSANHVTNSLFGCEFDGRNCYNALPERRIVISSPHRRISSMK